MSVRRLISLLVASFAACLIASLLVTQPAFAGGKNAYFTGNSKTSQHRWVTDHCEMHASAGVKLKGKKNITLYLHTNIDGELNMVHEQVISGPMDHYVHLYDVPMGLDGDSVTLEWTLMDRRERVKCFFVMGPFDCNAP